MTLKRSNNCRSNALVSVIAFLILSGCGTGTERNAVCDRSNRLNNELSTVNQVLNDIVDASPQQLANSFTVALSTLTTLSELGASALRDDFKVLFNGYDSVARSIEATQWNGAVAVNDPDVIDARSKLLSTETVQANDAIRSYMVKNCALEFEITGGQFPGVPTTLPNPVVGTDNAPEPTTGYDNEDSIASSYGYFVAEQFDLALTNDQAICVGRILNENALVDLQGTDSAYTQFISAALKECGVDANISGS